MLTEYRIIDKQTLTHNTFLIVITPLHVPLPLVPTSSFYYIYDACGEHRRPYTPIESTTATLTFAIKVYPTGRLSTYINTLQPGDSLSLSEPVHKALYVHNQYKDVLLIAGGTGITPMLQILSERDSTNFVLILCNLTHSDVFLKQMLKGFTTLRVVHCIESVHGRLTREFIENEVVVDGELLVDFCYVCGPPAFVEAVGGAKQTDVGGFLKAIGMGNDNVYRF